MTERIERMYADLKGEKKFVFCGEKYRIVIDSWRKHEGLTPVLKRAQATADYFDQRTLYVDPDELIVGNVASKPHGLEASVWGPFWDDEDLDSIISGGQYSISDEDRKALREGDSFWEGQDRQMYEYLRYYGLDGIVAATKADKLSGGELARNLAAIRRSLDLGPDDALIPVSALKRTGTEQLLEKIREALE